MITLYAYTIVSIVAIVAFLVLNLFVYRLPAWQSVGLFVSLVLCVRGLLA